MLLAILLFALIQGLMHAIDPDHLAAVLALVSGQKNWRGGAKTAAVWGAAHMVSIVIVGGAFLIARAAVPDWLGAFDYVVAGALIVNGAFMLWRWKSRGTAIVHNHGFGFHVHVQKPVLKTPAAPVSPLASYAGEALDDIYQEATFVPSSEVHRHGPDMEEAIPLKAAMGWGLVQGLAGSGAVAVIAMSALPNPMHGVAFISAFSVGTIVAMAVLGAAAGVLIGRLNRWAEKAQSIMRVGAGLVSISIGLMLAQELLLGG